MIDRPCGDYVFLWMGDERSSESRWREISLHNVHSDCGYVGVILLLFRWLVERERERLFVVNRGMIFLRQTNRVVTQEKNCGIDRKLDSFHSNSFYNSNCIISYWFSFFINDWVIIKENISLTSFMDQQSINSCLK